MQQNVVATVKDKIIVNNFQKQKILCIFFYNNFENMMLIKSLVLPKKHWMELLPMESPAQQQKRKELEVEFEEENVIGGRTPCLHWY